MLPIKLSDVSSVASAEKRVLFFPIITTRTTNDIPLSRQSFEKVLKKIIDFG